MPDNFARQQHCESERLLDHWLPDPSYALTPYEALPARAALWVHELTDQCKLTIPFHDQLELVALPLSGSPSYRDLAEVDGASHTVTPWAALSASAAGVELSCPRRSCRIALCLIAPHGTLSEALLKPQAKFLTSSERTKPIVVRHFSQGVLYSWNNQQNHARILFGGEPKDTSRAGDRASASTDTAPQSAPTELPFSLTILVGAEAVSIPVHAHASAWENLLVLQSKGALELRGRSYSLVGGEVIHIAPGVRHGYQSAGSEPLVAVQLYTPAGPEQRFIEAARAANTPLSGIDRSESAKVTK